MSKTLSIGSKIGKLTILEIFKGYCSCLCDCGNFCTKSKRSLSAARFNNGGSCGCAMYQYLSGKENYQYGGYEDISAKLWDRYKANAKHRGINFDLSIEQAWDIFEEQNRACELSGVPIRFSKYDTTASLDRVDSAKGYKLDNVRWVHKIVNEMKWDLSDTQLFNYCNLSINPLSDQSGELKLKHWHKNFSGVGNISKDYWSRITGRCKKRGYHLGVTINETWNLFLEQNGSCAITGLPLNFTKNCSASLDRINNSRGYEYDNIRWVHKDINSKVKKGLSDTDYFNWCYNIVRHKEGV